MAQKMRSAIEKLVLSETSFEREEIEPTFINFLFGKNGAGKSTAARAIREGHGIQWRQGDSAEDYEILVYDTDFVERNFANYGSLAGVFTVCETNIAIQQKLDELSSAREQKLNEHRDCTKQIAGKNVQKEKLFAKFQETCWQKTKGIREAFKEAVEGRRSKEAFAEKMLAAAPFEHDLEELKFLYETAFAEDVELYHPFLKPPKLTCTAFSGYPLMEQVIVSSAETPFTDFIKALNAVDWVHQGQSQFVPHSEGKCPFCQQLFPADFEQEITACFDAQYQENIAALSAFAEAWEKEIKQIRTVLEANLNDLIFGLDLGLYRSYLKEFLTLASFNQQKIEQKLKAPADTVILEGMGDILETLDWAIETVNGQIEAHNSIVRDAKAQRASCTQKVRERLAFSLRREIEEYSQAAAALESEIKALEIRKEEIVREGKKLAEEIGILSRQTVSTQAAIESINLILQDTGFHSILLREKADVQNTYEVIRPDGSPANRLSEGERNFIAFLYFYHLVRSGRKRKIVVVDDPVSSMDSGALFVVAALVREMIEVCYSNVNYCAEKTGGDYIKQLFILTHNTYFHREVTYDQLPRYESVSFFLIRKQDTISHISLCVRPSKGVLAEPENYNPVQDSYAALWEGLRDTASPTAALNLIRQILHTYFLQQCGYAGKNMRKRVLEENKHRFLDTASSGIPDYTRYHLASAMLSYLDLTGPADGLHYVQECDDAEKYKAVFKLIFEAMGQDQHYQMMMRI